MKHIQLKVITVDWIVKAVYVMAFLAIIITGVYLHESEGFSKVLPIEERGEHRILTEQLVPREFPETILAEDGKIFCFFLESELINVYSDSGAYLYGIQVSDGSNGRSDVAYRDGRLYVKARVAGIYVFEGTTLVRFEEQSTHNDRYFELQTVFDGKPEMTQPYFFVTDTNAIMRGGVEGAEVVVQFPQRKYDPISFLVLVALMLLLGETIWKKDMGK